MFSLCNMPFYTLPLTFMCSRYLSEFFRLISCWNCQKIKLSLILSGDLKKKIIYFRRPSWIYANCTSFQKLAELNSSQISFIIPVKDKQTKQKSKYKTNKTVNSDYVGVCLHKQSLVVYLKVNIIRVCFKLPPIYSILQIHVYKIYFCSERWTLFPENTQAMRNLCLIVYVKVCSKYVIPVNPKTRASRNSVFITVFFRSMSYSYMKYMYIPAIPSIRCIWHC